jgi:hypothetical protein
MAKAPKKTATTKKPKADKAPKTPKAAATPKAVKAAPKIFNNDDPEAKALFLQHLPKVKELKEKLNTANANLRNAYKSAKAQGGFEKSDFDYAIEVETAEKEAKARAQIARRLTIARYMGSDLGAQLDLFLEPDRTPAADRAYHEGQSASMKGESARPDYAPETEQYRQWMKGYNDDQEQRIKKGIKKTDAQIELEEEIAAKEAKEAKTAKQKKEDAEAFDQPKEPVTSGTPMSRAEFLAQQQAQADKPKSHFSKAN